MNTNDFRIAFNGSELRLFLVDMTEIGNRTYFDMSDCIKANPKNNEQKLLEIAAESVIKYEDMLEKLKEFIQTRNKDNILE